MLIKNNKLFSALLMVISAVVSFNVMSEELKKSEVPPLSVQLWSVKTQLKDNFHQTLQQLAEMGFDGVEFANEFGPFTANPSGLKSLLDELNLAASGAHIPFSELNDENFYKTVAFYKTLGVTSLVIGWDERAWHPEGILEVVDLLNGLSEKLRPYGMLIGFHNHAHEFNAFQDTTYWDYMAVNTHQSVVLQQDVGWTTYAGKDPVAYVEKYPGRTYTTHYKVRLPEGTEGKKPLIGQDTIDWQSLLQANIAVGGTQWIVVEQEEYPDGMTPLEAVATSKQGLEEFIQNL